MFFSEIEDCFFTVTDCMCSFFHLMNFAVFPCDQLVKIVDIFYDCLAIFVFSPQLAEEFHDLSPQLMNEFRNLFMNDRRKS